THRHAIEFVRAQRLDVARLAAGRDALERAVVEHDDAPVAVEAHVELDAVGALGEREFEGAQRVLGRRMARTSMAEHEWAGAARAQPGVEALSGAGEEGQAPSVRF